MFDFYRENARWLLGGFLLTFFSAFGQTFFISIWGSEIRQEFGLSHGSFGTVYMTATLASACCFPFVGRFVDRTSVVICAGVTLLFLICATVSMGFITSVPMLIAVIFLLRLFGQGMMGHTAMTAMGRWYSANRGKAVSASNIGHQCSEALMPSLFVLIAASVGWRNAWLAAALLLLLVALPAIIALMRVERIPRTTVQDISDNHQETGRQWQRDEVLRDPLFWMLCTGVLSPAFIGTSIWFHQDYLIELNGWKPEIYYSSFALMAVTTVCVTLVTGYAIDRWSAIRLLPLFLVPLGVACLILANFSATAAIFATMFFMGLSYGVSSALFGAVWPEIYGVRHLGSVRSVAMALMVFASAAGPGITGILIDYDISFPRQLFFIGFYCLLGAFVMLTVSNRLMIRAEQGLEGT